MKRNYSFITLKAQTVIRQVHASSAGDVGYYLPEERDLWNSFYRNRGGGGRDGEEAGKGRKSAGESELLPTGGGEVSVHFQLS